MSVALAAICGLLAAAAARELWAEHSDPLAHRVRGRIARLVATVPTAAGPRARFRLGSSGERLRRAGIERSLAPGLVLLARGGCALAAVPLSLALAPVAPGRLGALVAVGVPAAAAALPDLALERLARRRERRIAASLADALELMAIGAGAGEGGPTLLAAAGRGCPPGPLREELLTAVAEVECGVGSEIALRRLGERAGADVAALASLVDRSRRLGSPLAAGLQEQALALRERQAREFTERAERAAPKIQLAVALLLVPSVLLLVAAAIIANAEAMLAGL